MTLYAEALEAMERELFPRVMRKCGWNVCAASEALGLDRKTLTKKLNAYGICKPEEVRRANRAFGLTRTLFPHAKRANLRWVMELAGRSA